MPLIIDSHALVVLPADSYRYMAELVNPKTGRGYDDLKPVIKGIEFSATSTERTFSNATVRLVHPLQGLQMSGAQFNYPAPKV